jgi:hypothetical protein
MYWQYTTAFAVSVAAENAPAVRKTNDAIAALIVMLVSSPPFRVYIAVGS